MSELQKQQSPLDGFEQAIIDQNHGSGVAFGAYHAQGKLLIKLRVGDQGALKTLEDLLQTVFPERHSVTFGDGIILATAPGEWMLLSGQKKTPYIAEEILKALRSGVHSNAVIDMSAGLVALNVKGPRAFEALQAGCPVDLSDRVFHVGHVVQSLFGRYSVTLHRSESDNGFVVLVARSFARALCASLTAQNVT